MTYTLQIRRLFALPPRERNPVPIPATIIEQAIPMAGEITLITGPSGSGKSRLLRALQEAADVRAIQWIDPSGISLSNVSVIDSVCDALQEASPEHDCVEHALELLSRVGLAEAWTYLQTPGELSEGQRWRLMLALGIAEAMRARRARVITALAMDEFAGLLDRITARVVARALRKVIDRQIGEDRARMGAIVATSHDDLHAALQPERIITCDFDRYSISDR